VSDDHRDDTFNWLTYWKLKEINRNIRYLRMTDAQIAAEEAARRAAATSFFKPIGGIIALIFAVIFLVAFFSPSRHSTPARPSRSPIIKHHGRMTNSKLPPLHPIDGTQN
jgi:hypothetical protein